MAFNRSEPYNDLPLLPPGVELESRAVLKQAIAAVIGNRKYRYH